MNHTDQHYVPLFLQVKRYIEDMIVSRSLDEGEPVPSSTQIVKFFQVNHVTVLKGMNLLAEEGIIYKKRGVGMFVSEHARDILLEKRRRRLASDYLQPLLQEARTLGISVEEIHGLIEGIHQEEGNS